MAVPAYIICENVPIASRAIVVPFARIRVHRGGDPEGLGPTLLEHYADPMRVWALINLGWLDRIGKFIQCEDINDPNSTVAWARDRDPPGEPIIHWDDDADELMPRPHNEIPWVYQFRSGNWWVASSDDIDQLRQDRLPSCSAFELLDEVIAMAATGTPQKIGRAPCRGHRKTGT